MPKWLEVVLEYVGTFALVIATLWIAKYFLDRVIQVADKFDADRQLLVLMEASVFLMITGAVLKDEILETFHALIHKKELKPVGIRTFVPVFLGMSASFVLFVILSKFAKMMA